MQQLHAGIDRVIKIARSLRDTAGELGKLDLKSQIIDEISTLQELRDDLDELLKSAGDDEAPADSSGQDTETISTEDFKLGNNTMAVIQPSGDTDTYQISPTADPEPEAAAASSDGEAAEDTASGGTEADPEREKRAAQAQTRIAELEPMHAAAAQRVNKVLTPEQNQIRVKATKAARAAGQTGAEARNYIYAAMKLSDEQKTELASAKKELNSIRAAIAKEIKFLLDEEQKKRVAAEAHIQLAEQA